MISPRTNESIMNNEEDSCSYSSGSLEPLCFAPFPDLPSNNSSKKRVHFIPQLSSSSTSAPISLPETHIHRTPSELQFVADTLHAEYKDGVMYSRLMMGMHQQMQHRCMVSGSPEVHPLSAKSILGIINTKQANDHELMEQQAQLRDEDDGDGGWCMSYSPIDEETNSEVCSFASSPPDMAYAQLPSSQASKDSLSTLPHEIENGGLELEDDCVFSLEL